ncbi:O-antigen ligase family protein [Rummeliibacillus sp. NPDC094406]|uniref:O-antigen ligase family protein n=1 Tax=Rummeliibacillus sp. NPDC094406 TaxID=3364511 RepID=UPI0037F804F8
MNEKINMNFEKLSITTILYSISLLFIFTNNHNALMIADYYQLFVLTIIVTLLSMTIRKNQILLNNSHLIILIFLMNFMIVNLLTPLKVDRGYFLSYLLYICLYLVMTLQNYNAKDIYNLISAYTHSALIMALMVILIRHNYYAGDFSYRYTVKFRGNETIDPNYLAAYIVIPALFAFKRWLMPVKKNKKIYYAFITIIISFSILLTGSRAALISLSIGATIMLYYYLFKYKRVTVNTLIKIFVIILISVGLLLIAINMLPQAVMSRLFESSYNDGSNQLRISHWIAAMDSIGEKPILGYGALETKNILLYSIHHYGDVHSTILSFWLQTGLVGLLCIILLYIRIWIALKKSIILKGILLSHIFTSLIISSQLTIGLWTLLILLEMIIHVNKRENIDFIDLL